jgi:hypothetical protein
VYSEEFPLFCSPSVTSSIPKPKVLEYIANVRSCCSFYLGSLSSHLFIGWKIQMLGSKGNRSFPQISFLKVALSEPV